VSINLKPPLDAIAVNSRELLIEKPRFFINYKIEQCCPPLAEVPIGGGGQNVFYYQFYLSLKWKIKLFKCFNHLRLRHLRQRRTAKKLFLELT
jgi:hypothetical protein